MKKHNENHQKCFLDLRWLDLDTHEDLTIKSCSAFDL